MNFGSVEEAAVWILRVINQEQAQGRIGVHVDPAGAIRSANLDEQFPPNSWLYGRAIEYLESEGALVEDKRFQKIRDATFYTITAKAFEMLGNQV